VGIPCRLASAHSGPRDAGPTTDDSTRQPLVASPRLRLLVSLLRLLVSLLRRPLSDADVTHPARRCWRMPQKHAPSDAGQPVLCASSSTYPVLVLNRIRTLLDSHMSCLGFIRSLFCMFLYLSFVFDSPPLLLAVSYHRTSIHAALFDPALPTYHSCSLVF